MEEINYKLERIFLYALRLTSFGILLMMFTSCGTMLGGKIQTCQKKKPNVGHREINPWVFIADIPFFPIAWPIDFNTGAIYKTCTFYESTVINRKAIRAMKNR